MAKAARVVGAVSLALCLLGVGFCAVLLDGCTRMLCEQYSGRYAESPFGVNQLVRAGIATKAYSFEDNDRDALATAIAGINEQAGTPYANVAPSEVFGIPDCRYTLDAAALSHLDDCYRIAQGARIALGAAACLAAACIAAVALREGRRGVGTMVRRAAAGLLCAAAIAGIAAAIDFNAFFTLFHRIFFTGDTWLFPYDSLLISMYPEPFWTGMGIIWIAASAIACLAAFAIGTFLKRGKPNHD